MNKITASIIIPCSRPELAKKTIQSLERQAYPREEIEIIVVGEGDFGSRIRKIEGGAYPGEKRNLGAKRAEGDFLLFIDDDCEADKNWIKENIKALDNQNVGAVSGMIIGKSNDFFARCTDFSNFDLCQTKNESERVLCTASMGVRKDVFQKSGGFDESLRVGEDLDFCYKLRVLNFKTVYQPKIKVFHNHRQDSLPKLLKYMYFGGKETGLVFQERYPNLNKTSGIFSLLKSPWIFLLSVFPLSFFMAVKSLLVNVREHAKIILYFPFIFLAKVSYNLGIFSWLRKKKNV